ncbi:hypothetical protein SERLADRAFT_404861 [Serpula lacrymans var. lacrymans S7.9]|uniref:Uncharacterized protein n=1 Tax=Serpula lacrymans var. lacrymans (strain S7.9) TaxID=578457 RepID=F8NFP4_SERL9|nr:uncharacterized protein SERLADRAFT_404861 [Serpula lacrymans var. lacrymans S7.9]EGO30884.1 hypothetical protein SERLADRAFT_404861 [Serpula lacrymans var. lacrymans S7.9]
MLRVTWKTHTCSTWSAQILLNLSSNAAAFARAANLFHSLQHQPSEMVSHQFAWFQLLVTVITELSAHNKNMPLARIERCHSDGVPSALHPTKEVAQAQTTQSGVMPVVNQLTVNSKMDHCQHPTWVAIANTAAAFFAPNTQGLVPGQTVTGKELTFKNVKYLELHSILEKKGYTSNQILIIFGPPSPIHKTPTKNLHNCFLKAMGVQDASAGTDNISNPMSVWDVSTAESFKIQSNKTSNNRPKGKYVPDIGIEHPQIGLIFPVETCFTQTLNSAQARIANYTCSDPLLGYNYKWVGHFMCNIKVYVKDWKMTAGQLLPQERNLAAVNEALQEAWHAMVDKVYPGLVLFEALKKGVIINTYLCYTTWYTEHKRSRNKGDNTESGGLGTDAAGNSSRDNVNDGGQSVHKHHG